MVRHPFQVHCLQVRRLLILPVPPAHIRYDPRPHSLITHTTRTGAGSGAG